MKRLSILSLCLFAAGMDVAGQDQITHDVSQLPEVSRSFMAKHYNDTPVSHIEVERAVYWKTGYDVILTDGTNIEFSSSGEWKEIDGKRPVPVSVIPEFIRSYVHTHYPKEVVTSIERERGKYSVDLSNERELTFNKKGKLIEID